jgi:hypothetical protein
MEVRIGAAQFGAYPTKVGQLQYGVPARAAGCRRATSHSAGMVKGGLGVGDCWLTSLVWVKPRSVGEGENAVGKVGPGTALLR